MISTNIIKDLKKGFLILLLTLPLAGGCTQPAATPQKVPTPPVPVSPPSAAPKPTSTPANAGTLKIKWLGQSTFVVTSATGMKIITDPYTPTSRMGYADINESADIVTVSHEHGDHNNVAGVGGNPAVVRATAEVKGIKFRAIPTYHDASQGKERGNNTVICFEVDGFRISHLGDLGHPLSETQVGEIGRVDILLIPVGGFYTIDAKVASQVCDQLNPGVIFPMHYKTAKSELPVAGIDEFLQGKKNVITLDASEMEFKAGQLPADRPIVVLKPAR